MMRRIMAALLGLFIVASTVLATTAPADAAIPRSCPKSARVCINLTKNVTWLQSRGKVVYGPVRITSGRNGYRTPRGTYHVTRKDQHHVSSDYNAPMPYSVFFNGGIAFHQGSLRVKSHGCIHLSLSSAKYYFRHLHRGDKVVVFGRRP